MMPQISSATPIAASTHAVVPRSSSESPSEAAVRGEPIPDTWAVDPDGRPTTDPFAAMQGALTAFGGSRGANIALMVEVLAAGLTGGNWSLDAADFQAGAASPGVGLFVLALSPYLFADHFSARLSQQAERLSADYGVYVPGLGRLKRQHEAETSGIVLPRQLFDSISSFRRN